MTDREIRSKPQRQATDQHGGRKAEPDLAHEAGDDESGQGPGDVSVFILPVFSKPKLVRGTKPVA